MNKQCSIDLKNSRCHELKVEKEIANDKENVFPVSCEGYYSRHTPNSDQLCEYLSDFMRDVKTREQYT